MSKLRILRLGPRPEVAEGVGAEELAVLLGREPDRAPAASPVPKKKIGKKAPKVALAGRARP